MDDEITAKYSNITQISEHLSFGFLPLEDKQYMLSHQKLPPDTFFLCCELSSTPCP